MSLLRFLRKRRILYLIVLCLFVLGCFTTLKILSSSEAEEERKPKLELFSKPERKETLLTALVSAVPSEADHDAHKVEDKQIKQDNQIPNELETKQLTADSLDEKPDSSLPEPNYNIHIFYYAWYGNPEHDGRYVHWNHQYLPHWNPDIAKQYQKGYHSPPNDIGANFYPALGPYSSKDPKVIDEHMRQMRTAGVGVIALSWYPPGRADNEGIPSDGLVPSLLNAAAKHRLKVTLHIEPYKGRDDKTVHSDVKYIIDTYGKHEAFYKYQKADGRSLPMLYIYDSYHTPAKSWAQLLTTGGAHSVRNTPYDCIFIALMVEMHHRKYIDTGGFDGFYTYFATDKFTYGSTWRFWPQLKSVAEQTNTLFIPSVGPGYIDTAVRPWNSANMRLRNGGDYYRNSWKAALQTSPHIISITSFNEWHEGTQIEKAIPKSSIGLFYKDYSPNSADFYLKLTKEFVEKFA